jgi:hypothetical protein
MHLVRTSALGGGVGFSMATQEWTRLILSDLATLSVVLVLLRQTVVQLLTSFARLPFFCKSGSEYDRCDGDQFWIVKCLASTIRSVVQSNRRMG